MSEKRLSSSFRDPSGYLFVGHDGALRRSISRAYKADYEHLMTSGLYSELIAKNLIVSHSEEKATAGSYKVIKPEMLPFISYPYEWSFSQLKDAALATLEIQKLAMKHGMFLKDGSAYNIQFHGGKPILIDSLSFERYETDKPWIAYRQFCQHFLAPLTLASYVDIRLLKLLRDYIDGIPLDLAASLLPKRTKQFLIPLS